MKIFQTEFCHNCQKMVRFEFEDIAGTQQVLNCPECGHEHYRILDEGLIIDIRVPQGTREVLMIKMPELSVADILLASCTESPPFEIETHQVIANDERGTIIEKSSSLKGTKTRVVTEERWGRDPRQVG